MFLESVNYKGTGTYGSENMNSLSFSKTPKIVIIAPIWGGPYLIMYYIWNFGMILSPQGMTEPAKIYVVGASFSSTIKWYSLIDASFHYFYLIYSFLH